jgi:CHAT domain-containing protein/Tfp pilus assembly protein PilF
MKSLSILVILFLPAVLVTASGLASAQSSPTVSTLAPGQSRQGDFSQDHTQNYAITLKQNQYCRVVVVARGLDVVLAVYSPSGELLAAEGPGYPLTKRVADIVAGQDGDYRVELRPAGAGPTGAMASESYTISIEDSHIATPRDIQAVAAEKAFAAGESLFDKESKESSEAAIKAYERALELSQSPDQQDGQVRALERIGQVHYRLADYKEALECYEKALALARSIGDRRAEAALLDKTGHAHSSMSQQEKALELYNLSLGLAREIGDKRLEGNALNDTGLANSRLSRFDTALEYYNQALPIRRELGDRADEATTLGNIGLVYSSLSQYQKALEYYDQSLPISRSAGDRTQEARTLNNIGIAYLRISQFGRALDYFNQSLPIRREVGDRSGEANTLGNMGVLYRSLSQYEKALEYYGQSLAILRAIGDQTGQAVTFSNIGVVYRSLDQQDKAFEYFNQSLPISRALGNRIQEASTLNNMGLGAAAMGQPEKALGYYGQALAIQRAIGDRGQEAGTLNNVGRVQYDLGQYEKALELFNQSLPLARALGDRVQEGSALCDMATAYARLGQAQKARPLFAEAGRISHDIGDRILEIRTLDGLAHIYRSDGNLAQARSAIEDSILLTESVRSQVAGDESRSAFFSHVRARFDFYIELLVQLNEKQPDETLVNAALEASERARARGLLDLLTVSRIDIQQGVPPELKAQEQAVEAHISQVQSQLVRAHSRATPDAERIAAMDKELAGADDERQQLELALRRSSPRYADLKYPSPLKAAAIQKLIEPGTLLLEYSLGDKDAFVFAVTADEAHVIRLVPTPQIRAAVERVRESLTSPRRSMISNYVNAAAELYQELIAPASGLLEGKHKLVIVPDGVLHYLPFEVLLRRSGSKIPDTALSQLPYLVRDFSISYAPSMSVLGMLRADQGAGRADEEGGDEHGQKDFIAFADPDYGQAKNYEGDPLRPVVRGAFGAAGDTWKLDPLPASRGEVEKIASLFPKNRTALFVGTEATEENVKADGRLLQYRYIHFAVHGFIDEAQPQFSSLIFSLPSGAPSQHPPGVALEDGLLHTFEVFNLRLHADLVTLSSCETGLGKEVKGEGLIGLTRAFFYAGAPSLLVSLWKVDDRSTGELMQNFYRQLLAAKGGKAEALREAKLALIRNGSFAHPYYWAPFVLTGRAN